mgnify:CR=1 FL=1
MKKRIIAALIVTHIFIGAFGFALGVYALPILTAPSSPTTEAINAMSTNPEYTAVFSRELKGSDFLHWGEGKVSLNKNSITFIGELAPGPDYKLYLSPKFVETEVEFMQLKHNMIAVGDVKTFKNFIVEASSELDLNKYNSVIVWCESFEQFITSAKYR